MGWLPAVLVYSQLPVEANLKLLNTITFNGLLFLCLEFGRIQYTRQHKIPLRRKRARRLLPWEGRHCWGRVSNLVDSGTKISYTESRILIRMEVERQPPHHGRREASERSSPPVQEQPDHTWCYPRRIFSR